MLIGSILIANFLYSWQSMSSLVLFTGILLNFIALVGIVENAVDLTTTADKSIGPG